METVYLTLSVSQMANSKSESCKVSFESQVLMTKFCETFKIVLEKPTSPNPEWHVLTWLLQLVTKKKKEIESWNISEQLLNSI